MVLSYNNSKIDQPLRSRGGRPNLPAMECGHTHERGRSDEAVSRALAKAEARCQEEGQRWTPPRRRVFEMVLKAHGPVKAYDLMAGLGEGDRPAYPPTVYRALEFLEGQGLVHRIAGLNAFVACGAGGEDHAAAFLICDCCGSVEEFDATVDETARRAANARGFRIRSVALEARGLCHDCVQG